MRTPAEYESMLRAEAKTDFETRKIVAYLAALKHLTELFGKDRAHGIHARAGLLIASYAADAPEEEKP